MNVSFIQNIIGPLILPDDASQNQNQYLLAEVLSILTNFFDLCKKQPVGEPIALVIQDIKELTSKNETEEESTGEKLLLLKTNNVESVDKELFKVPIIDKLFGRIEGTFVLNNKKFLTKYISVSEQNIRNDFVSNFDMEVMYFIKDLENSSRSNKIVKDKLNTLKQKINTALMRSNVNYVTGIGEELAKKFKKKK